MRKGRSIRLRNGLPSQESLFAFLVTGTSDEQVKSSHHPLFRQKLAPSPIPSSRPFAW